jgi:VWFA-related protein
LFMDLWHVSIAGSYRAQSPMTKVLDRVIGQDDLIAIMTPEMSARNLTVSRRTSSIANMLREQWYWGQRDQLTSIDPREEQLRTCYPDSGETAGSAEEVIGRRRETKTLDAIEDLIVHLEGLREERKFVMLLTEGWILYAENRQLARPLSDKVPGRPTGIGVGPDGRVTTDHNEDRGLSSCERERSLAAFTDNERRFPMLLNRANRANVSFYPIDARGLQVFDSPVSANVPLHLDIAQLNRRLESVRTLALNSDGVAIVDTNAIDKSLERIIQDVGVYYLLGYYSTNTKLDGKFRKLTVRVKRPEATVRARPGYLAPTEADAASARVDRLMNGAKPGYSDTPPELRRALDSVAAPSRGIVPLRLQAAATATQITITSELDATTAKNPEWQNGGRLMVMLEHESGATAPIQKEVTLAPGQRIASVVENSTSGLAPGRYVLRLSLTPSGSSLPLQLTADVTVPRSDALLAPNGVASRRGPTTGLQYQVTADARYQRTERIRFEVPKLVSDATTNVRLLNRSGQALPLGVTFSERLDEALKVPVIVVDLPLAPLAQGEYVLEVSATKQGKSERAIYAFRIVP